MQFAQLYEKSLLELGSLLHTKFMILSSVNILLNLKGFYYLLL